MLYRTINLETHRSRKRRGIRKTSNEKEREREKSENASDRKSYGNDKGGGGGEKW